jgi:prepilin-type processing-associated H-X9-DG protein
MPTTAPAGIPASALTSGGKHFSVFIQILPFLEQDAIASKYDPAVGWNSTTDTNGDGIRNIDLTSKPIPTYLCPSMLRPASPGYNAYSSYAMSRGNFGYYTDTLGNPVTTSSGWTPDDGMIVSTFVNPVPGSGGTSSLRLISLTDISDGTSNTIMGGDKSYTVANANWTTGNRDGDSTQPALAGSPYTGNTNWVFPHPGADACDATTNTPMNTTVVRCASGADTGNRPGKFQCAETGLPNDNSEGAWYKRTALGAFRSNHAGGCNFVFGDGSVKFLRDSIKIETYRELGSRAGGGVIESID